MREKMQKKKDGKPNVLSCEYLGRNAIDDLDCNKARNVHSNGIILDRYIYILVTNAKNI